MLGQGCVVIEAFLTKYPFYLASVAAVVVQHSSRQSLNFYSTVV